MDKEYNDFLKKEEPEAYKIMVKREFLRNKFQKEQEKIKTAKDYLSYYLNIYKYNQSTTLGIPTINRIMSILNDTMTKDYVVFHNGGSLFDIFEADDGEKMVEAIGVGYVYAYSINGEFTINNHISIPSELYHENNYDYVLENF